jgi:hypothetical protein
MTAKGCKALAATPFSFVELNELPMFHQQTFECPVLARQPKRRAAPGASEDFHSWIEKMGAAMSFGRQWRNLRREHPPSTSTKY